MVAPFTPPTCDLRDFPFIPLQIARLKCSRAWLLCKRNPALAFYLVNTWTAAYHAVPAGSLEDDDLLLADLAMCDDDTWSRVKDDVLRGWVKCDDGRLYNATVAEQALEGWLQKLGQRKATAAAAAKRAGRTFDPAPFDRLVEDALAHLQRLNANSRLLLKRGLVSKSSDYGSEARPQGAPSGPPGGDPGGEPNDGPAGEPPGAPLGSPHGYPRDRDRDRDREVISSDDKSSEAQLPSAETRSRPPDVDPDDPVTTMFALGKRLWGPRTGGSLVGKLRKAVADDGETACLMRDIAQDMGPDDGKSYLMGIVKSRERSAELTPRDRGEEW